MGEDHYATLGVAPNADAAVIRAAYLALVRLHHPDAARDPDARRAADQRTQALNAAYRVVGDPQRRADYDALRVRPRLRAAQTQAAPVRDPFKVRPRKSKGPTLAARRERLERVRLVSVGLALLALLLVFVAFTGAVGALRPALPAWLSPRIAPSADGPSPVAANEAVADVMLPWPQGNGARRASLGQDGLVATFGPTSDGQAPTVQIAAPGGKPVNLEGPIIVSADQSNLIGFGRLEGADAPGHIVLATPLSADRYSVHVAYRTANGARLVDIGEMPADVAEQFPVDLNRDGRREWIAPDARFVAAFGPSSPAPPRVLQFRSGRLVDVSTNADFREIYSAHLAGAQPLCTLGSSTACAGFVASAARLGRASWAWDIMLRDREYGGALAASPCTSDAADCPTSAPDPFIAQLRRFLVEAGYVSAPIGRD